MVIAIIAVLVGLLLPAVQHGARPLCALNAKTTSNRLDCALINYHDSQGSFPMGDSVVVTTTYGTARNTWMSYLFPYIEQNNLNNAIDYNVGLGGPLNWQTINYIFYCTSVKVYNCPSQPVGTFLYVTGNDLQWARSSYVGCFSPNGTMVEPGANSTADNCNDNPNDNPGFNNPMYALFNLT